MDWSSIAIIALVFVFLYLQRKINGLEVQLRIIAENLERIVELTERVEQHTEKASEYLYGQALEYQQYVSEIDDLKP